MKINNIDSFSFKLFASCINVKGAKNSLIMDLERESIIKIPNLLSDVLIINAENISIRELKKKFNHQFDEGINKYFNFLVDNDYGFFTKEPDRFPPINSEYLSPFICLTSVVCYDENSNYNLINCIKQIIDLGAQSIQIRINKKISKNEIEEINDLFKETRVKIVELILIYENNSFDFYYDFNSQNDRLYIYVLSSPTCKFEFNKHRTKITLLEQIFLDYPKEIINKFSFNVNTELYIEALNYNIGLNRKISIDYNGDIKNYVDHKEVYGNIKDDLLSKIISLESFQVKWELNNDKIEKCKDCQFRYMCLSNSDIEKKNNKYYKKNTCSYDPYYEKE